MKPMPRAGAILWMLAATCTACGTEEGTASGGKVIPPVLEASNGKPVPPGFTTRITDPDGKPLELAYTQASGLTTGGTPVLKILALAGPLPDRVLEVRADLGPARPAGLADLEGKTLRSIPGREGARMTLREGSPDDERRGSATVTVAKVTGDAIEGTVTVEADGWTVRDAPFRARRSPSLDDATLAAILQMTGKQPLQPASAP